MKLHGDGHDEGRGLAVQLKWRAPPSFDGVDGCSIEKAC
jgi:hypothetical protein